MDRQDRETRRAENQVWNGWGDYARKPELLTFDRAGDAELYGMVQQQILAQGGMTIAKDPLQRLLDHAVGNVREKSLSRQRILDLVFE